MSYQAEHRSLVCCLGPQGPLLEVVASQACKERGIFHALFVFLSGLYANGMSIRITVSHFFEQNPYELSLLGIPTFPHQDVDACIYLRWLLYMIFGTKLKRWHFLESNIPCAVVWQWRGSGVAVVWQWGGGGVAVVWQGCGSGVAVVWQWCGGSVAGVLQGCGSDWQWFG